MRRRILKKRHRRITGIKTRQTQFYRYLTHICSTLAEIWCSVWTQTTWRVRPRMTIVCTTEVKSWSTLFRSFPNSCYLAQNICKRHRSSWDHADCTDSWAFMLLPVLFASSKWGKSPSLNLQSPKDAKRPPHLKSKCCLQRTALQKVITVLLEMWIWDVMAHDFWFKLHKQDVGSYTKL